MGADGGSFVQRSEAVKTKSKAQVGFNDRRSQLLAAWFTCALSKRDLQEPLVADALGKIYNKDALLEYLLAPPPSPENPVSTRPFGADGLAAAGHLRSLKDVQQLKLTPASATSEQQANTSASHGMTSATSGGSGDYGRARWECPITMRGMNGSVKFVYVKGCGCVASESGIKELAGVNTQSPKEEENEGAKLEARKANCPVCGEQLPGSKVELVTLNPTGEEKEAMAQAWKSKVAKEEKEKADKKAAKKLNKKRKDGPAATEEDESKKKKSNKTKADGGDAAHQSHQAAPSVNRKLPTVPEAKKPVSSAIASLYSRNDEKGKLSPFFAGSYSRF